jgi:hypothetical protein
LTTDTSNPTSGWPTPETRSNALPKSAKFLIFITELLRDFIEFFQLIFKDTKRTPETRSNALPKSGEYSIFIIDLLRDFIRFFR